MLTDLQGMLVLGGLLAFLVGGVEALSRRTAISPEYSRKLVHLGGGFGCLLFPLLLDHSVTVLFLAVVFSGGLWLAEHRARLRCLCRVERHSRGSMYYPFAIAALFHLTSDQYGLYASSVLVLTVADTAAALLGSRYGRFRYRVGGVNECKSLEGSVAFWTLAFLAVFLPLAWPAGGIGIWQALLSAFLAATLLTMVEAVSSGGSDNLYVPILCAFLLLKTVTKPVPELVMQSASMVLLFSLLPLVNRCSRMLRTRAVVSMSILLYGVWSLGSADWAIPMLLAVLAFFLVFSGTGGEQRHTRAHRNMVLLSMPSAVLVLTANLTGAFDFVYGLFLAAVSIPLLCGVVIQMEGKRRFPRWSVRQVGCALAALVLVFLEPIVMGRAPNAASILLMAAGILMLAWIGTGLSARQAGFSGAKAVLATTLAAIVLTGGGQYCGLLKNWQPSLWADVYLRDPDVLLPLPQSTQAENRK